MSNLFEFLVDDAALVDEFLHVGGHLGAQPLLGLLLGVRGALLVVALDLAQLPLKVLEQLRLAAAVATQPLLQIQFLLQRLLQRLSRPKMETLVTGSNSGQDTISSFQNSGLIGPRDKSDRFFPQEST